MASGAGVSQAGATKEKEKELNVFASSVINKSTKRFAPKAIRRRAPAPTPAPGPLPVPATPSTGPAEPAATPVTNDQPPQPPSQNIALESQTPTPSLTQETITPPAPPADAAPRPSTVAATAASPSNAIPTPAPTPAVVTNINEKQSSGTESSRKRSAPALFEEEQQDDGAVSARPAKTQRLDSSKVGPESPVGIIERSQSSEGNNTGDQQARLTPLMPTPRPTQDVTPATAAPATTTATPAPARGSASENLALPTPTASAVTTPQPRESASPSPAPQPLQAETSAAPATSIATPRTEESEPPSTTDEAEQASGSRTRRRAPAVSTRRKRKATEETPREDDDGEQSGPVAKKARKVRKDKGTRRKAPVTEEGEDGAVGAPRQKPKKARKKRTPMAPTEGGEGEGEQAEPRPRGRPKRGPTPDDAEEYEVTPDTSMATLAARDPRRGKLSTREKAMREIDWDEVKRRRQERALEIAQNGGGANSAEVDERLNHAANERSAANEVPQLNYDEHGNIAINPDSLFSDRRAEATQDEDVLELRVEDDLTRRFNMHSHLRDNRRDPVDRVMSAPQKWTIDATNEFYNALTIFGTDFSMIATLFPNKTRRHCKHKFGREERLDPERIKEALMGRKDNPVSFEQYLKMSGKDASTFKDPRALEAELKAIDDDNQIAIEKAREEYEKDQKNRQLAGVEPSGEQATAEGGEEGATEKRRKKERKKSKGRPVGGEEVEILETIDD